MNKKPAIFEATLDIVQDADCCDPSGDVQKMKVTISDGGGGPFIIIETERWAMDSPLELTQLIGRVVDTIKPLMVKWNE